MSVGFLASSCLMITICCFWLLCCSRLWGCWCLFVATLNWYIDFMLIRFMQTVFSFRNITIASLFPLLLFLPPQLPSRSYVLTWRLVLPEKQCQIRTCINWVREEGSHRDVSSQTINLQVSSAGADLLLEDWFIIAMVKGVVVKHLVNLILLISFKPVVINNIENAYF